MATKEDVARIIAQKSIKDAAYRSELIANPKAMLERELGFKLDPEARVSVLECDTDTLLIPIPKVSSDALSERELDAVVGGKSCSTTTGCVFCWCM